MTPAARVQAAIEILDRWADAGEPITELLAAWGSEHRFAGSADRRAIGDLVFDALRRRRSAAWVAGAAGDHSGRNVMLGSLVLDGFCREALEAVFTGERHAPAALSEEELARLGRPLEAAPRAVRLDLQDWVAEALTHLADSTLALMRERAPVFLRVNLLKTDVAGAITALAEEGVAAEPGPLSPTCLRVVYGHRRLNASRAYRHGLVEIQDAASQAAADYARARPGEIVLDYCAGAGGKTLALAAAMEGKGELHAHDVSRRRLGRLVERAARAGVTATVHAPLDTGALAGRCDLVFVDAPCSGSGTWRRRPDARWRMTRERVAGLLETQDEILDRAGEAVRPGGRLVYATCSLLEMENMARVEAFLARHPEFRPGRPPLRLTPADGGDGFFACELIRRA